MDKCLLNGEVIYAFEIAKDYHRETDIRKQSRSRTLLCSDADCRQPVMYRHGEVKCAHFAHFKSDVRCPYDSYYRGTPEVIRNLKILIYEHFKAMGCDIDIDVKVIAKHHTPILITLADAQQHAIEFSRKSVSANELDNLKKLYDDAGISVEWVIVDSVNSITSETHAYYVKRFQLNESAKRTAVIFDKETAEFEIISFDENEYPYSSETFSLQSNIFRLKIEVDDLTIKDGCLCTDGFQEQFDKWIDERKSRHERKVREAEEKEELWFAEERRIQARKREEARQERQFRNDNAATPAQAKKKADEPFCLAKIIVPRTQQPLGNPLFVPWDKDAFVKRLQIAVNDDEPAIRMLISKVFECQDDELAMFLSLYYEAQAKEPTQETKKYIEICEHILRQARRI